MLRLFSRRFTNFRFKNNKKGFLFIGIIFIVIYLFLHGNNSTSEISKKTLPCLNVLCHEHNIIFDDVNSKYQSLKLNNASESKTDQLKHILLILNISYKYKHFLEVLLESLKINFDLLTLKNVENAKLSSKSYSLVVIEDLILFYKQHNSKIINVIKYCQENNITMISGVSAIKSSIGITRIGNLSLYLLSGLPLYNFYVTKQSSFLYFTKASKYINETYIGRKWSFLIPSGKDHEVIAFSEDKSNYSLQRNDFEKITDKFVSYKPIVIRDFGYKDGIKKLIFSADMSYWLNTIIFMDALKRTIGLDLNLTRYIQIDIDDIFVGKSGSRMVSSDVEKLISTQKKWSADHVRNFKFNLGFSGFYFKSGSFFENRADEDLIKNHHLFNWFPHMWSHKKPHLMTREKLVEEIRNNIKFAESIGLNTSLKYAIAPFHSGVYPAYDILYELWTGLWNISVTSTEEYPKLNPARNRRGFVYKNITVLPRQTCGIYTHTLFLDKYPKGKVQLDKSILGGSLFQTVLFNEISIFMTHFSNFGSDQLGIYTFDSLFRFIKCYTNLELVQKTPTELSKKYFSKFPSETNPIWYNPCVYKRHKFLLPITYNCSSLPKFIIVGPQKTASTALHKFLNIHPEIFSNTALSDSFEEPQFFGGAKYKNGIQWYMGLFNTGETNSHGSMIYFEKSATYFDHPNAPELMFNLLPDIKIIVLLMNPIYRAYSWYQHMLAHSEETALKYTFHDIVTNTNSSDLNLIKLRNRCLIPGLYYDHLQKWIRFYSPNNIIILDSDHLTRNPITLMNGLQSLLPVRTKIDYSQFLIYSDKKGFYCSKSDKKSVTVKCLGPGKGRHYKPMGNDTYDYLYQYFLPHNRELITLLRYYRYTSLPQWLVQLEST